MRKLVRRGDDQGFTMIAVLASAMLVMGLVLVVVAYAQSAYQRSRTSQDSRAALAAAQAGVADYISRLNNCETYFLQQTTPQGCSTPNSGLGLTAGGALKWATLPGTAGADLAQFNQQVLLTPNDAAANGMTRIQVTGRAHNGSESRTLVVDLKRKSFLDYLYFTDYETFSPKNTSLLKAEASGTTGGSGFSKTYTGSGKSVAFSLAANKDYTVLQPTEDQVNRGCRRYYYASGSTPARGTFPRTVQWTEGLGILKVTKTAEIWPATNEGVPSAVDIDDFKCLTINFGKFDVFSGPVHTNDALSIGGAVKFLDTVTSGWNVAQPWYGATPYTGTGGNLPKYEAPTELPATTDQQKVLAAQAGCVYTGPTSIEFLPSGKLKVKSPQTLANSVPTGRCTTGSGTTRITDFQIVDGPENGTIYVQGGTLPNVCVNEFQKFTTNNGTVTDITNYDNNSCMAGDAFVQGTVKGNVTIAAAHDVIVTDDIVYSDGSSATGTDRLGLIGSNNVAVWHPVSTAGNMQPVGNLRIDAAIASVQNSFTVLNYNKGAALGTLTINGVIIQRFRGPVATTNSGTGNQVTGYAKDYRYDKRLNLIAPRNFIRPVNDPWLVASLSEQKG